MVADTYIRTFALLAIGALDQAHLLVQRSTRAARAAHAYWAVVIGLGVAALSVWLVLMAQGFAQLAPLLLHRARLGYNKWTWFRSPLEYGYGVHGSQGFEVAEQPWVLYALGMIIFSVCAMLRILGVHIQMIRVAGRTTFLTSANIVATATTIPILTLLPLMLSVIPVSALHDNPLPLQLVTFTVVGVSELIIVRGVHLALRGRGPTRGAIIRGYLLWLGVIIGVSVAFMACLGLAAPGFGALIYPALIMIL